MVKSYQIIGKLRRNEKSYFSWLPKEIIKVIQELVMENNSIY